MKINTANFGPCLAKIQAKGKLSDLEARDMLNEVAERAEKMRQSGVKDPFVTAAGELAANLTDNAIKDRLDALRNTARRKAIYDRVLANYGGDLKKAALSIESELVHVNTKMADQAAPVEEVATGILLRYASAIDNKLRQDGIEHAVVSGALDREISKALFDMSGMGPKLPKAGKDPVSKAAAAFDAPLAQLAERLKASGARFDRAVDYVTHTSHDPRQMKDAGFDAWWKATKPRLSDYTFRDLGLKDGETMEQAKDRFGQSVYNALITGVHLGSDHVASLMSDDTGFIPPAFEGTQNLAKKFSHERVMFWKSGEDWFDHMRQFGGMTTLYSTIHSTLQAGSNAIGLMEKFGTNPMASLKMLTRKVETDFRDSNPLGVIEFQGKIAHLENVMGRIDGSLNRPVNADFARFLSTARTIESATMLGNVGVTHLMSLPATLGSIAPHYGLGRAEVYGNALKALMQGVGAKEKQDLISEAGAFSHGSLAHYMAQLRTSDNIPGRMSALAGMFLKATGLNYVLENTQNGVRYLLMHHLGRQTDVPYAELNPLLRDNLGRYGITEPVWDAMRALPDLQNFEGRQYITPHDLARIPDATIDAMNAPALAAGKTERAARPKVERPKYQGTPLADDEIDTVAGFWKYANEMRAKPKPQSLSAFVVKNGGVEDPGGDVLSMIGGHKGRPGLVRKGPEQSGPGLDLGSRGLGRENTLDDMALRAWEAGFFPEHTERPTINEFLDKLGEDLQDGHVVREADQGYFEDRNAAEEMEKELEDYGISAKQFRKESTLREFFGQKPAGGPDEDAGAARPAEGGEDEALTAETERLRAKTRWELQDNYAALLAHAGREATVAGGARERAWMLGATRPGTLQGELWRLISQFKVWPVAVINQIHGRDFYASQSFAKRWGNIGTMVGLSTIGGMLRMAIKDVTSGSTPRDPRDIKTMLAAMAQGGGVGILGDFAFGEVNRMGGGVMTTLAGPVVGDAANFANIFMQFRDDVYGLGGDAHHGRGNFADVWPSLARWATHKIPFSNLIGLKGSLDYLVWNSMFEAMSPGWWERQNRKMQRDQGRSMMYYKPGVKPPGLFSGRLLP
jgi:hypothetical protein